MRGQRGPASGTQRTANDEAADDGELRLRLAVAALGIPISVAVVWAGGWVFVLGVVVLGAVSAAEFAGLLTGAGRPVLRRATVVGGALFPLAVHVVGPAGAWQLTAAGVMAAGGLAMASRSIEEGPATAAALTLFGVLYTGGLLSFGIPLREVHATGRLAGTLVFFLPVTVTWLVDTAAYVGGRRWGRRPLAPRLSPNKTVAGAVAALAAGPLATLAFVLLLLPLADGGPPVLPGLGPSGALVLGLLISGAAVVGDLAESALKRECGAKDASGLLPGHGGLLDRVDSLLWTVPTAHAFLLLAGAGG